MPPLHSVVVTGASTGIGLAIAERLVRDGTRVFASVRQESDAQRLRQALGDRLTPLRFDVTDEEGVARGAAEVARALEGRTLGGLVNNAGIGIGGPLLHQDLETVRRHYEVNVIGVLRATRAFAPLLGTDRARAGPPGRIVNISSVSGLQAMPFMGAYAASKHALEGASEALRRELMPFGIDVIIIGPGRIATPIWDKAESLDPTTYAGTPYADMLQHAASVIIEAGKHGLPASRVASVVREALTADRPRVRYAIVNQPVMDFALRRLLPRRMVDRMIARRLGIPADARE